VTPLGHAAVSALAARLTSTPPAVWLVGGMAPDVDFLLLPLPGFDALHRVVTHNLLFVSGVALVCALWVPRDRARAFLCALIAGLMHLGIDAVLDSNPANGIGVALWWPFAETLFSPFNLLEPVPGAGWSDPLDMLRRVAGQLGWEIPFWAAALAVYVRARRRGGAQKRFSSRTSKPLSGFHSQE